MKKYVKIYAMVFLLTLLIITSIFVITNRKPIEQATINDIQAVQGIGEVLSLRIVDYIESNPNADIEDLIVIKGIGPEKVKLLRKEFK